MRARESGKTWLIALVHHAANNFRIRRCAKGHSVKVTPGALSTCSAGQCDICTVDRAT